MSGERLARAGDSAAVFNRAHTLVVGSGAAGLNAALQLRANGVQDVVIVTEGLEAGTSINTGSDKQTYYKLSLCGDEADAPRLMAETYFDGGGMHGDLALVEAGLSPRAFLNLVNLGVPFPRDAFGQFVGYKTDHDPRQRATSIGPYTSREMCRALIREVRARDIPVRERRTVVRLLVLEEAGERRAAGVVALTAEGGAEVYLAENTVFAVGGPGGLYKTSVYPDVHTGAIGLALAEGARAQGLPESQFGLASIGFRWNVSGTYMQVMPRFFSTAADGQSEPREFLGDFFATPGDMHSQVFLKGYQWPFDARKVMGGSSIIDILVYIETVLRGRRVYLDFRRNPEGFSFAALSDEAAQYLARSGAGQALPLARLEHMNPGAVALYREHGIDLAEEPLEIAVCAQHNNGGLAANLWWESVNVRHLFPVGEVNGSHGVARPGGSALNAGQVGGFRAAEFIANRYAAWTLDEDGARRHAQERVQAVRGWLEKARSAPRDWRAERAEFQARMSRAGAHIRSLPAVREAVREAWQQCAELDREGCRWALPSEGAEALRTQSLCWAHAVYLEAIRASLESGAGSRGSSIVLDPQGRQIDGLEAAWRFVPEDESFRERVLETTALRAGEVRNAWVPRRPLPTGDTWFETAWAAFRDGRIYEA